MRCNIYKDQFQSAELFGKPVLYTEKQIQREDVPEGWYCYDLTGTDRDGGQNAMEPYRLRSVPCFTEA